MPVMTDTAAPVRPVSSPRCRRANVPAPRPPSAMWPLRGLGSLIVAILTMAAPAAAQQPVADDDPEQAAAPAPETIDIFDLWRKVRHKERRMPTSPGTIASRCWPSRR